MSASYLVKRQVTLSTPDSESVTHYAGNVLSDWELTDFIKDKIDDGVSYYTQNFEKLTDKEADAYRKKATAVEGKRTAPNGQIVDPPWDDFIGLHPKEVIDRMKHLSFDDVEKVRQYERAGLNRDTIIEYVAPSEREPWPDYDQWGVREILDKLDILDPQTVQDVIVYEMNRQKRAAIITYMPEDEESEGVIQTSLAPNSVEESDSTDKELAGAGASTGAGGRP